MPAARIGICGLAIVGLFGGCQRGCARAAVEGSHVREVASGVAALNRLDCPDGLARCEASTVSASRLATVPYPCTGPASTCTCPWDAVGDCPYGCVSDGLEMVVDTALARAQLCASAPDAGPPVVPWTGSALPAMSCDEGDAFRCEEAVVVDCRALAPIGRCLRGCYRDGATVTDDEPGREKAFALLCSR